ncbi:limonene-1,2-epoxide hydrolase family protein [Rhodococcus artemisiae]|uniref:Limonene-1,2-epoxide hydrolase family protein n=1 Tax=Rhodococcus artemisiae TaxID=714159 RepID=A0ABU7LDG1_9NOCA|nr:limonene-1,2-epoxide hydrolase family protein [Rhodococcus artemisiae]MEE2059589.1 limonene-1,2-epoxide hydrolase family protein [Rhodococcus artemisiae]
MGDPMTGIETTPTTPDTAITTVREFLEALAEGRPRDTRPLMDPDMSWHNTSLPTLRGARRISTILAGLEKPSIGFDVVVHHIAAESADVVLTERTDVLRFGRIEVVFPVCGTFELRDGHILAWRDHFDVLGFLGAAALGLVRAAFRRS